MKAFLTFEEHMSVSSFFFSHNFFFLSMIGVLGVCIGSFLNVVIYRLPLMIELYNREAALRILRQAKEPSLSLNLWHPSSFCTQCSTPIPLWAKVPLINSLILMGKTNCCSRNLSLRYLLIEILTASLALLLALKFGPSIILIPSLALISALIALFFIDLDHLILPDEITLPFLWLGLFVNTFSIYTNLIDAMYGAIFGFLFFYVGSYIVLKVRKIEGIGEGDLKLLSMLGAWFGWQLLPALIFIASLIGAIIGLIYIIQRKEKLTVHLPFGPFLSIAAFSILMWGNDIASYSAFLTHIL